MYFKKGAQLYTKSQAVTRILNELNGIYPLLSKILNILPVCLMDRMYDLVAKYRYQMFGKSNSCFLGDANKNSQVLL